MKATTINSIGSLIDEDYSLTAYCDARVDGALCGHNVQLDLEYLASKLGRDHPTLHKHLVPKLKCSKCGSIGTAGKDSPISIRLSPPFRLANNSGDVNQR